MLYAVFTVNKDKYVIDSECKRGHEALMSLVTHDAFNLPQVQRTVK